MALVLKDRVKETTSTTGTGTVTLAGASSGYQSFSVVGNGNDTYYTIAHQTLNEWEVGIGTYTSSGTTLSRTTVLSSSNSGSLVNFSVGTKDVFVTQPAEKAVYEDLSGNVTIPGQLSATSKSFDIAHPDKPNARLVYGSLEGPENGVYVRGRTTQTDIVLPAYWKSLIAPDTITVHLTPFGYAQSLVVISADAERVRITRVDGSSVDCYYSIFAERKDIPSLKVEVCV